MHVEPPIVEQMNAAQPRLRRGFYDVPGVLHSVDVANLVAVEGRDRQLGDAQFFQDELNDDLGVEMKVVRVFLKRHLGERGGRVEAIAGVKLGEIGSK